MNYSFSTASHVTAQHFTCWSWNTHSGQTNAFYFFPTVIPRQYIGIWKDSNGINKSDNQPSCGRLTLSLQTHTILPKIFSRCLYTYCVLWMWVSGIQFLIHQVLHDVRTAVKVLIALAFMRRLSLRFRNVFIEMIYHSSRTAFVWPDSNVGQDCLACRINQFIQNVFCVDLARWFTCYCIVAARGPFPVAIEF